MTHVWTHTSIAQGIELAFERSERMWWDTLQIFAKSPRGWTIPQYTHQQIVAWQEARKKCHQHGGVIHSNYLVNLSKSAELITQEIDSVLHDFTIAHALWYQYVNVHIGKSKWYASLQDAMMHMAKNVERICKKVRDAGYDTVQFLFENTAWQWTEIGSTLEELSLLATEYMHDLPVKYCIDTAHCHGWGIAIDTWDLFVEEFDKSIGIDKLAAIHLNDAKVILWSKLDRHACLGHGAIGWHALSKVIEWAYKYDRDLFIETPDPDLWEKEIAYVRRIGRWDLDWIDEEHQRVYCTQMLKKFENHVQQIRQQQPTLLF
jgi:deoxyribonuclease IV